MGQIVFKLSEVMRRHGIRQRQLAAIAKVRPAAINALYHGNRERVNVAHLVAILDGLYTLTGHTYTVADLLEYTPAEATET
ncbi:helix-turn-helix transcriptional regulator [Deinococcus sp. Arct2-2]|uniref:helix-turn-helix domain-containing protein n=1 Tax=Deinococcus sp. Arct2-2 TaxID=2568653 RepID=UPI0010A38FEE|nr:helix-turn-helix transcriptional regulator [Deinococcus sp. Arct2-2]THF68054.1 helix-turn-helix transcriptional regulator [Deinococcus sp. Arct2-2]